MYMRIVEFKLEERMVYGIIESGVYGVPGDVRDTETHKLSYRKKKADADVLPFYFLMSIPKGTDEGILILQRTGKYGCQTNLSYFLNKQFRYKFPHCCFSINTLVLDEVLRRTILRGTIKKLTCVKYQIPIDIADGFDFDHKEVPAGNLEFRIKAKNIPVNQRIDELFDKKRPVQNLVELRDINFAYDTVQIAVDIDGDIRHYDLGNIPKIRNSLSITKDIEFDDNNRPSPLSIHRRALRYLAELNSYLYKEQC